MTHTPPFNNLDLTKHGHPAGCEDLATRIEELGVCRLHVFGHIHEAHGANIRKREVAGKSIQFISVNAALARSGQAIIVDLQKWPEGDALERSESDLHVEGQ